eukprot:4895421-Amphidinium_carterae.1
MVPEPEVGGRAFQKAFRRSPPSLRNMTVDSPEFQPSVATARHLIGFARQRTRYGCKALAAK